MSGQGGSNNFKSGTKGGKGNGPKGKGNRTMPTLVHKFHPYLTSKGKRYATYTAVVDQIKIKVDRELTNSDYIIECLKNRELFDMRSIRPVLMRSDAKDPDIRDAENLGYKVEFENDMKTCAKAKDKFKDNISTVRGMILGEYCTPMMIDKL